MDWSIRGIARRALEAWRQRFDEVDQRPEPPVTPITAAPLAVAAQPKGGSFDGAPGRDRFAHAEELRARLQGAFDGPNADGQLTAAESEEALNGAKSATNVGSNALSVVPVRETEALRTQALGSSTTRSVGGIVGVAGGIAGIVRHTRNFELSKIPDLALDAGNTVVGSSQSVAAAKEAKALATSQTVDDAANAAGKVGAIARFGGLATGVLSGGLEVFRGVREDDNVKVAQGGVTIAGTVAGFAAVGAIGGPAGIAVGAGIGLATFGVRWGIGKLFGNDDE
jgi:hypothetical protein